MLGLEPDTSANCKPCSHFDAGAQGSLSRDDASNGVLLTVVPGSKADEDADGFEVDRVARLVLPWRNSPRPIFSLKHSLQYLEPSITENYRLVFAAAQSLLMVAPATQQSGQGGRSVFNDSGVLRQDTNFGIVKAGAPPVGTNPNDSMICMTSDSLPFRLSLTNAGYYNGTPAACAFVGLDYVVPNFTDFSNLDLVIAGPNEGTNLGPFLYTLTGTLGYTYVSIGRHVPAIAFSSGNTEHRQYTEVNKTMSSGYADPATIQAQLVVNIMSALVYNTPTVERLLPSGYGISVDTPYISSSTTTPASSRLSITHA